MKLLDLLHRWTGGLIGLLLALMGLSGAILLHKDAWIMLPHAGDAQIHDTATVAGVVARLTADPAARPTSFLFADENFGLHRVNYAGGAGAYADQGGEIVTRWAGIWDRPELWLFDFHHYLFSGETGAAVAGTLGLIGLGFVVTGAILWWPQRRTFRFRLWPARMTRPAIVRQHRDLGIVIAPLLFLSMLTGVLLALKPVREVIFNAAEMRAALGAPAIEGGPMAPHPDWNAMLGEARRRFPDAEFRTLGLPREAGDLIVLRMKQPAEWLPNGRTTLWFDPADGHVVAARDALALPAGPQIFNAVYPIHAAKVGGLTYRLVMTLSGLALALLGSLAVWSFWFRRPKLRRPLTPAAQPEAAR